MEPPPELLAHVNPAGFVTTVGPRRLKQIPPLKGRWDVTNGNWQNRQQPPMGDSGVQIDVGLCANPMANLPHGNRRVVVVVFVSCVFCRGRGKGVVVVFVFSRQG